MTLILKFIFMENWPKMRLSTQVRMGYVAETKSKGKPKYHEVVFNVLVVSIRSIAWEPVHLAGTKVISD